MLFGDLVGIRSGFVLRVKYNERGTFDHAFYKYVVKKKNLFSKIIPQFDYKFTKIEQINSFSLVFSNF